MTQSSLGRLEAGPDEPASPALARLGAAFRLAIGVVIVVAVSVGVAWSAHRYALTSPRFAVRDMEVTGATRFGSEQVATLAGVAPGSNLFALDTSAMERRLLENPWIERARVTRRLPSALTVELTERKATAVTVLGGRLYLVSQAGEPFKAVEAKDPVDLPVVTGLDPEQLSRDRRRELERLRVALDVLRQYGRIAISKAYPAQEVHLGEGGSVTLMVGREGLALALGKGPFRQRLQMVERVIQETKRAGRLPGIVFADNEAHPERVVVRMR